ncbi:BZ3500_MvSof-1268-A1-R1_Chr3-1g05987 [Microbotryum saponariae]|uniref:BZ3500_MvSof-1268-A1-R1_Chr3-1g05987 protein n=1 Tax=Microbotryum saponariae TaxID=289078 RepID=A0A2X0NIR7_9BASI|nr:BZ3500_MvSof-1268-A1-R1_Chr3-1g05987 [Microbotryum saponariae]SDA05177.1 BZ3501_MvSof-1269-A2-R1_Chr3-1g05657 [Microbotryum saponariae]
MRSGNYLDRVKVTFNDQAEVYDRFLTIMKEFKSQGIDTPGVIERVSTLFRGHPALIQGFNTFLPPGYRIECSVSSQNEAEGGMTITVTTPMGSTTRTQVPANASASAAANPSTASAPTSRSTLPLARSPLATSTTAPKDVAHLSQPAQPASTGQTPSIGRKDVKTEVQAPSGPSGSAISGGPPLPNSAPAAAAPPTATAPAPADAAAKPPMEFNHAINYVNKIKNRFVREPDTYKAFLEILQTYQKEGRAIQDVYAQVTILFRSAPDLLDEFKQFLPDTSAEAGAQPQVGQPVPGPRGPTAVAGQKRPATTTSKGAGEPTSAKKAKTGKNKAAPEKAGKRKTELKDPTRKSSGVDGTTNTDADPSMGTYTHPSHPAPYGQSYPVAGYGTQPQVLPVAYAYEAPLPPPPAQPLLAPKPHASVNDIAFFSRVKVHTNDQATYYEFLKLLNLYTQDIIDLTALVSRAFLFIGQDALLWREFRDIVGWTDGKPIGDTGGRIEVVDGIRVIENVPTVDGPKRARADDGKLWESYGPSYRKLPPTEISLNCSGRDALCWEVLNDEWVSQPSWASDEGFAVKRQNPFEEAMHKSEEERHEYDYYIEANLRTIALLEPIATRIAIMEADERATFRLKPGLGNQSKSIYQRVIKKVYGKVAGREVIQALHENPCVAVPIVLARLKQKDEEWKRALREWNRVWRENDAKNYWRSLDHQSISIKANDKRLLTLRHLVTEIETVKRQQRQRASGSNRPWTMPSYQLQYELVDRGAMFDTMRLVFSYLDRTSAISNSEKDKVETFMRQVLPLLFALSPSEFSLMTMPIGRGAGDDDSESLEGASEAGTSGLDDVTEVTSSIGGSATGHSRRAGRKMGSDLRKKALKNAVGPARTSGREPGRRSKVSSPAPSSRGASPAPTPAAGETDQVMADALPTVSGLASMVTPEVEAEAGIPEVNVIDSSREQSADVASPQLGGADVMTVGETVSADMSREPSASNTLPDATDSPELVIPVEDKPRGVDVRKQWNVFANSNLYGLVRVFQVIYSRLVLLKTSATVVAVPPPREPITEKSVPSLSLSLTMAPPEQFAAPSPTGSAYYQRALALCEALFDGQIDQMVFEEKLRHMFATQGYMLATIDRLIHNLVRLATASLGDGKTQDLVELIEQDRSHSDRSTPQQQMFYRAQAESALGNDENLYRIEWVPSLRRLRFQLLGKDVLTTEDMAVADQEWKTYMEQYVLADRTPGLNTEPETPFLTRNLRKTATSGSTAIPASVTAHPGLQSKICMRSYRIFYVAHTEDLLLHRRSSAPDLTQLRASRSAAFEDWLEKKKEALGEKAKLKDEQRAQALAKKASLAEAEAAKVTATTAAAATTTKIEETPFNTETTVVAAAPEAMKEPVSVTATIAETATPAPSEATTTTTTTAAAAIPDEDVKMADA